MPARLYLDKIEAKPKHVLSLDPLSIQVSLTAPQQEFLWDVIEAIKAGNPLPKGAYRTSGGRDTLLEKEGVMHLHLGSSKSAELLYVVQYPDHVVFLEIGGHNHLTTNPVGKILQRDYAARLRALQERRRRRAWLARQGSGKAPKDKA